MKVVEEAAKRVVPTRRNGTPLKSLSAGGSKEENTSASGLVRSGPISSMGKACQCPRFTRPLPADPAGVEIV